MIAPGWMPSPLRALRRRTMSYTRVRRVRRKRRDLAQRSAVERSGRSAIAVNNEGMLFAPGELPVATVILREPGARVAADTKRWAAQRWSWLRPRALPIVVAVMGLVCVVASGRYLSRYATNGAPPRTASLDHAADAQPAAGETYYRVHLKSSVDDTRAIEVEVVPSYVYK
jgi:hypothetical protein